MRFIWSCILWFLYHNWQSCERKYYCFSNFENEWQVRTISFIFSCPNYETKYVINL